MIDICARAGKTVWDCRLLQTRFCAEIWLVIFILICFIHFCPNIVCFIFFLKDLRINLESSDVFMAIMRSYGFKCMNDLLMSAAKN